MRWLKATLSLQIVLAVYFESILWFRIGAWNDQPGKRLIELVQQGQTAPALGFAGLVLVPLLLFILAFWNRWLGWASWVRCMGGASDPELVDTLDFRSRSTRGE